VSVLNRTTGAYLGSVRTRFSNRKPQTHAYAPLSPALHYNPGQGVEMGLPDFACAVYRASQRPYRRLFEAVWGP
jgi:hypothetical protein